MVDGCVAGGGGWMVSHRDSVPPMSCWRASLLRSNEAVWAVGLSGSVPSSMRRMGPENALASEAAERVMVISPPFSGTVVAEAVMEGGRSAAVAIKFAA